MSSKQPLRLSDLDDIHLTGSQAFVALHEFLAAYAARLSPPGAHIATITSDTEIEPDGSSSDPAALSDWRAAIDRALNPDDASN